jgi:hypothetical protein
MATFASIKLANSLAVPAGTDLVVVEKADGTPATYTLDELAAYISGVTLPQWLTDASNSCYLTMTTQTNDFITVVDNTPIPFNTITRDSGYYLTDGTVLIPTGVTKVIVNAQFRATNGGEAILIKNQDAANPLYRGSSASGWYNLNSCEIDVVAGDELQIIGVGVGAVFVDESIFYIKAAEKLI